MMGSRIVALGFDPEPGYWQSEDGVALIRQSANYARRGADLSVETLFSVIRPGEPPLITVHLRSLRREKPRAPAAGEVKITLNSDTGVVDSATLPVVQRD